MKEFIVIPVFNEEDAIERVLLNLVKKYSNIIVIDDGSTDDTYKILQNIPQIFLLRHIINRGQGASLRTGNQFALKQGADIIIHFDADGQHQNQDIPQFIKAFEENPVDIILGSRFQSTNSNVPFFRKVLIKIAILYMWFLAGIKFKDPQSGFRALNRKAAEKIKITQNRRAHTSEILMQIKPNKLKLMELPVTIKYTNYSKAKGDGSLNIIYNISKDLFLDTIFKFIKK